jgi:hypothetical protein
MSTRHISSPSWISAYRVVLEHLSNMTQERMESPIATLVAARGYHKNCKKASMDSELWHYCITLDKI